MTDAFNLLVNGEYIMGILNPFARIIGLEWIMFFFFCLLLGILYVKTESMAIPAIVGITTIASVNVSHLFSGDNYPIIPDQFDWLFMLVLGVAVAALILTVWFKR